MNKEFFPIFVINGISILGINKILKIIYINEVTNNFILILISFSFIFCSGFLSKSENSRSFKTLSKLLLIYLIFNFSYGLFLHLYINKYLSFLVAYQSYWYLLCLIYWRFSIKYFANQFCSIPISFIISILIGFWPEISRILSLRRTFGFFPYFLIGYKFSKESFQKIIRIRKRLHFLSLSSYL